MVRHRLAALVLTLGLFLTGPPPVLAAGEEPPDSPSEMAREGLAQLLRALEAFIDGIPQFEMPEVNEEGDIIIRRKRDSEEEPSDTPEFDQTSL